MTNIEQIDSILKDADEIPLLAAKFNSYSDEVLNYKPAGGWSALECFDHLIILNKKYIPIFEEISSLYTGSGEKPFKNSFFGKFLIKAVHPDAPRKVKTSAPFNPSRHAAGSEIINDYLQQHRTLRKFIESFREFDIKRIRVTSPVSSIVKYNLGDACRILVYHDLRHIKQAQKAAESYFAKERHEA